MAQEKPNLSPKEKNFLILDYLEKHPEGTLQDLYKWLFLGEFGVPEKNIFFSGSKAVPELHSLLAEIKKDSLLPDPCQVLWEPLGISGRFVKVFLTPYYFRDCPLNRLVNLMERSPAYRGSRMTFKLDWNLLKEKILTLGEFWTKRDFIEFEEEVNFHQLPDLPHSEAFLEKNPYAYRVVSQNLFFDYFPEYIDNSVFHPFDDSSSFIG